MAITVDIRKNKLAIFYISFLFLYSFYPTNIILRYYSSQKKDIAMKIIVVTLSDIIQYFSGKYFGITKFGGPSPNKTIEGYLGAIILTTLFCYCWLNIFEILFLLFSGFVGDMLESFIKRQLCIKDTSNLLGSHGGWIDRLDGIFMAFILYNLIYNKTLI